MVESRTLSSESKVGPESKVIPSAPTLPTVGSPARAGRTTRADLRLRLAVMASALVAITTTHVMLIGYKTFANVDEAYALALAARLLDGQRLYEGAISQRGPLMYYAYAFIAKTSGWDNVVGLRLWALGVALTQVFVVGWAGTKLVSHRVGSVAAVIMAYILVAGLPPIDGIALHGESMQAPLLLVGATAAVLALRSRRVCVGLALSGVLFGAAIAIKQSAILQPLPVLLYLVADSRRSPRPRLASNAVAFLGGLLAVLAACAVHAAEAGTLRGLLYYCFTYNVRVHLRPSDVLLSHVTLEPLADHVKRMTSFVAVILALAVASVAFATRRVRAALAARSSSPLLRGFGVEAYLVLHALVATFAGITMVRFFPHYYLPALPFVALASATWIVRRVIARRPRVLAAGAFVLGAVTVLVSAFSAYTYERVDGAVTHGPLVKRLARYIEVTTPHDGSVFVWGFSPWLYAYAHRKPAGRYVFETYVTGFVPWFFDDYAKEKSRVVPGSLEALLGDLDREKPELVVDAGSVLLARPMRAYPKAAAWLHEHYCFELRVSGYDVYRRKLPASGCASEAFPRAHPPVDFNGVPMPVPMPLLVDEPSSRALCATDDDDPVWFAESGSPPAPGLAVLAASDRTKNAMKNRAEGIAYPIELKSTVKCIGE